MREIKFRAWGKENKMFYRKFAEKDEFTRSEMHVAICENGEVILIDDSDSYGADRDNFIIQQFTGLKDCNGIEIYEGDIVRHTRTNNGGKDTSDFYPLKIKFKKDIVSFVIDYGCCGWHPLTKLDASKNVEIIGNIYENPELTGGENE